MAELDRCWRGPRERRIRVTPRAPYYNYTHILTRPLMYIGWTTSHFVIMFCLRDVLFPSVFCFVLFDCLFVLINEANWWTWDSRFDNISRYPPWLVLVPIALFPGFWINWDGHKRWSLLPHIFWSKIGSGFWEPDSTPPPRIFRSTPWETWSLVASLPVSIHLLIIKCFNDLHDLYDHDKFCVCL